MRSTMDLIDEMNLMNPGSAGSEWDGQQDRNGDGIPDGAEVSRVVSRNLPDGTAIKTTASWTKQPSGAMRLMEPGASNADIIANYPRAGSGITANQYRGALFAAPDTRTIQGQARADAGNRSMLATRNMQILGAQEAEANRSMMTALQDSRNRSAESMGRMKLQGDEAVARSNELAAQFRAQSDTLRSVLEAAQPKPMQLTPDGKNMIVNGQPVPIPQPDPGKLEMQKDPNTGATIITQGGRLVGTLEQPKTNGYPPPPPEPVASTAQTGTASTDREKWQKALKAAMDRSDAEAVRYFTAKLNNG